jgi:TRAP-type transport system periplasmic protein
VLDKHWDLGFRQITTGSNPVHGPDDLRGLKIRVPVAPLFIASFKALGASPTPINFDELYSAPRLSMGKKTT